jgi:hypothetical protein
MNARSGSGIWYGPNDERNLIIRVPRNAQSNQTGKIMAVIAVVQATPPF